MIFTAIQVAIGGLILLNYCNQKNYGYLAAFEDKLRLLKEHSEPTIIVIGGSNVAFGIDSSRLKKEFGYPIINAGLHGALGLDIYLDLVDRYARHGDIVVFMPEWAMVAGKFDPEELNLQQLLRESPSAWKHYIRSNSFEPKSFLDDLALPEFAYAIQSGMKIRSSQTHAKLTKVAEAPGTYSRLNFNEQGDFIGHHKFGAVKEINNLECNFRFPPTIFKQTIDKFNAVHAKLQNRGVQLYFAYPPLPKKFYHKFESGICATHDRFVNELNFPVLHHPEMSKFPSHQFYDTIYHLNLKGKTNRTNLIARSLSRQLRMAKKQMNNGSNSTDLF